VSREAGLNKAPDAYRTISEVAEELDLPQHVLRFWESRFPHIKPLKRGGGRRYYRPEDVDLLRGIRRLLYADGYTIKGVQRILREQGVRTVQSVGQGQDVAILTAPSHPSDDDAPGGGNGENGAPAVLGVAPNESHPPDDAVDENSAPTPAVALARLASPPKNGPIVEAEVMAVVPVAKAEATKERVPVAASAAAGPIAVAVSSAAVLSPPYAVQSLAVRDLDRLKQALADLEACRRLLDRAIEG
jgi:DNA-binding transcriptional MerR regulator